MKLIKSFVCIILAVVLTASFSGCSEKTKSRLEMTPEERLAAALNDLYKGGNYDINIDIKYDIIDGHNTTEINTN